MSREDFIKWLDTIIDVGDADWHFSYEDDNGNIVVVFENIEGEDV